MADSGLWKQAWRWVLSQKHLLAWAHTAARRPRLPGPSGGVLAVASLAAAAALVILWSLFVCITSLASALCALLFLLKCYLMDGEKSRIGCQMWGQLITTALSMIQRAYSLGVLSFYNLPTPFQLPPAASASSEGVQFVLNTLPVRNRCIGDGDGFSAYVDTADPRESANVPLEVYEMVIDRTQARTRRDYQKADALPRSLDEAGYKILNISGEEVLAKKYRIRIRGIDAPELEMTYGKESKNALVKLIGKKRVTIYVYGLGQFGRYVGDIYCDNVFVQVKRANAEEWSCMAFQDLRQAPRVCTVRERSKSRTPRALGIG
ncbi:unnamed protein product [Urochloa humidicola]